MGCLKLTYYPEFLRLVKETAIEKSDHVNFLPLGEKNVGKENCDNYYPFGLAFNSYNRESSVPQKYKYNGKEEQTELGLGWLDYGARMYQPEIGRFFTQDRFAEKYYPLSPYQYVANNPVGLVDINGDSIWVTQNKGVWTIHMTGKVLNLTNGEAPNAEDFMNRFRAAFSGIEGIELDMQFSDVSSMDEVSKSDHLIAIVDNVSDGNGVSERGGKVAYAEGGRAKNSVLNTMVHEGGHLMGLNHGFATKTEDDNHINNMMNYPSRFASKDYRDHFTQGQASLVIKYWERGKLNYGSNSTQAPSNDPPQFVPSWLYNMYHSSTPTTPYRGEVKKGDIIPKPVQD